MADTTKSTPAEKPVIDAGDPDRVQGLSINKDGAPDQSAGWEFVGDADAALEATKEQFRQIAVSAVDAVKRPELGLAGSQEDGGTADAAIDALKAEHEKAEKAADKKAEAVVNGHTNG